MMSSMADGLIFAFLLDSDGGWAPLGWDAVEQWTPADGVLWVHLDYTSARSIEWITNGSGLDEVACEALLAGETRPRCTVMQDGLLAILRGVNQAPGADPEDMVSIRILANADRIISCRKRYLAFESDIRKQISKDRGPKSVSEVLSEVADLMVVHMSNVIEDLDDAVDRLSDQVLSGETKSLRTDIADTKRAIIRIRRYLSPQREALSRLANADVGWLLQKDRLWLREVADGTIRYLEDLDAARDRAAVTQEELTQRITERTENRVYLLTIVTTIFLPLGFITGLLGINVGGIPGAENQLGFLFVCVILLLVALFAILLLKWRKWF